MTTTRAKKLAERTEDAYSADRYRSWAAVAQELLRRGYTERQVEAVLRSKVTRWAADYSNEPYGRASSDDLGRFLDRYPVPFSQADEWAEETGL